MGYLDESGLAALWQDVEKLNTVDPATQSESGLMSASDKAKLDGIDEDANAYVLPEMSAEVMGGAKVGAGLKVEDGTLDVAPMAHDASGTTCDVYGPLMGVGVHGKSEQDGTPTPDAPVEIESVDGFVLEVRGKNLFGGDALRDTLAAMDSQSGTDEYGEYVEVGSTILSAKTVYPCVFKPDTQYTLVQRAGKTRGNGNLNVVIRYTDGTVTRINLPSDFVLDMPYTVVTTSVAGKTVEGVFGSNSSGMTKFYYDQCGIFEGTLTADQFEPYVGQSVQVLDQPLRSLPDGTQDKLTLSYIGPSEREGWGVYSRELERRVISIPFTDITWTYRDKDTDPTGQTQSRFTCRLNTQFGVPSAIRPTNSLCSAYAVQSSAASRQSIFPDGSIYQLTGYAALYQNGVNDSRFDNVADFLAANVDTVIQAALLTPTTETLDPIELPIITEKRMVFSPEAGPIDVTYIVDTTIITLFSQWQMRSAHDLVEEVGEASSAIATAETSPATSSHSVGDLVTFGGKLYKVTKAMASGEEISEGTNVTRTTMAREIAERRG